jgi:hypothetical protein
MVHRVDFFWGGGGSKNLKISIQICLKLIFYPFHFFFKVLIRCLYLTYKIFSFGRLGAADHKCHKGSHPDIDPLRPHNILKHV